MIWFDFKTILYPVIFGKEIIIGRCDLNVTKIRSYGGNRTYKEPSE